VRATVQGTVLEPPLLCLPSSPQKALWLHNLVSPLIRCKFCHEPDLILYMLTETPLLNSIPDLRFTYRFVNVLQCLYGYNGGYQCTFVCSSCSGWLLQPPLLSNVIIYILITVINSVSIPTIHSPYLTCFQFDPFVKYHNFRIVQITFKIQISKIFIY